MDVMYDGSSMKYFVLAYYWIGKLENPLLEVERHKEFFAPLDFKGRIYISEQGINGQASASPEAAKRYMAWMKEDPRFQDIVFKLHDAQEHPFPRMTVKYRKQLVALDYPVDFSMRGERLSPAEWKEKLEDRQEGTLCLDVRNDYEWQVGHFEGAELPALETFREFPQYAEELKKKCDPKTTPIMMYCTGGIRCEFFSAVLRQEGFEKVYQLEGGVIGYGLEEGSAHWKGKLFVFDDRMVVPIAKDAEPEPISMCQFCFASVDVIYNCANADCNDFFISCPSCLKAHEGCCCKECIREGKATGRLRMYSETGKPFRKLVR